MRYLFLLALIVVPLNGCSPITMQSDLQIAPELRQPPMPMREATGPNDVLRSHIENMESCAINASRYRALLEALDEREKN